MTTYVKLPDFNNGDIVSASRLNAVARNIDIVIGLDEQRVWPVESGADVLSCGIYSRASDARFGGNQATYYMAHNGDRLFFYHVLYGTGGTATLTYNNTTFSGLANSTDHYLSLPSLPRYKIVKIVITPSADNGLYVRRLYGYQSNAAAIGTMPSFTNGTTSSAGDLNAILAGTERAVTQLNQPIAGMYSVDHLGANQDLALGTNRNGFYGYIRHKHDMLYLELAAWVSDVSDAGGYMTLTYNNVEVWRWSPYLTNRPYGGGIYPINLTPLSLTVGTWYPIEFRMVFSRDVAQRATIWQLYEYTSSANSTITAMPRWEHGDTVNGNSETSPDLYEMSEALNAISTLRWTNPACRAGAQWIPNRSGDCDSSSKVVDEFASIRVHRWLAYEPIELADGKRATVTLQHKTGGSYTFTGTTLPSVTQPSYYDLDNTPIKPGMYFRLVGSKFLIQTPGYEGE